MRVNEILDLELDGLKSTIQDYCTENYILSYMNKLCDLTFPSDFEYIKILANYILEWYEYNIENIRSSKFITNVNEHNKSLGILKELVILLENKKEGE